MHEYNLKLVSETKTIARARAREEAMRAADELKVSTGPKAREKADNLRREAESLARTKALIEARAEESARINAAGTDQWFYLQNGNPLGPVSLSELLEILANPLTDPPLKLVWTQGMEDWKPYYEVQKLAEPLPSGTQGIGHRSGSAVNLNADRDPGKESEIELRAEVEAKLREAAEKQAAEVARTLAEANAKTEEQVKLRVAAEAKALEVEREAAAAKASAMNEARLRGLAEVKALEESRLRMAAEAKAAEQTHLRESAEAEAARKVKLAAEEKARAEAAALAKAEEQATLRSAAEAKAAEEARLRVLAESKADEQARLRAALEANVAAEAKALQVAKAAAAKKAMAEETERAKAAEDVKRRADAEATKMKAAADAQAAEETRRKETEVQDNISTEAAKARGKMQDDAELEADVEALGAEEARIAAMAIARAQASKEARLAARERSKSKAAAKVRVKAAKRAKFLAAVEVKAAEELAKAAKVAEVARLKREAGQSAAIAATTVEDAEPVTPPVGKKAKRPRLFSKNVWFYTCEGERLGPVGFEELRAMASSSSLDPRLDRVWKQGSEDWKPAGEIDGLFERKIAPEKSQKTLAGPKAAPRAPRKSPNAGNRNWPGARRRSLLLVTFLFPFVWQYVLASASPFLIGKFGPVLMGKVLPVAALLPLAVIVHFGLKRLWNLGMSRWWIFAFPVPVLNVWVGYRCFACPAGYAYQKKLDRTGVALAVACGLVLLAGIVRPSTVAAPLLDAIARPASWESII